MKLKKYLIFSLFLFLSFQNFAQEKRQNFLKTLFENKIISNYQRNYFLNNPKELESNETFRKILLDAPNTLHISFEKDFPLSGQAMFEVTAKKIANKFFQNDTLKIKSISTKPSQLDNSPFASEIHAKIQFENYNYEIKKADYFSLKDTSNLNNLDIFDWTTDINNFSFFNDFLLDKEKEDRIFRIACRDNLSEIFYLKINNTNFKKLRESFEYDPKFDISGGDTFNGFSLDKRFTWKNLNKLINEARKTDLPIIKSNEEIIYSIREFNHYNSSAGDFLYGIFKGNVDAPIGKIEFGGVSYFENLKNPFEFSLNILEKASNGVFKVGKFKDNIEDVQLKPFIKDRIVEVSFTFKNKDYKFNWKEETMPINANEEYLEGNNNITVLLKDVVTMANEAFKDSDIPYQFYLLQQHDGDEPPNTTVFFSKIQHEWFIKNFPDLFWDGIYPVR